MKSKNKRKKAKNGLYCMTLRLPQELRNEVKTRAISQGRSLNKQIIFELTPKPILA